LLNPLRPMTKHDEAILAFHEGRVADALHLLEELLSAEETSELWNDWAAVQLGAGQISQAEAGFTRALELDSQNIDATTNLGLLLLGRGEVSRAESMLKQVLPALPTAQQELVRALLAGLPVDRPANSDMASSTERTLRVLVINDTFPDPKSNDHDLRLIKLLHALCNKGNDVTFIARESLHGKQCEPLLRQAGIHTYGDDPDRLACLGRAADASSWHLRDLLTRTQFDVALLIQGFSGGISIPEHYLDDLRLQSPGTRIAVLADQLHGALCVTDRGSLADFEQAADWADRQWEAFERADAVVVPRLDDTVALRETGRSLHVEVVPHDLEPANLASALRRIHSLTPKAHVEEACSVMLVETLFRERLAPRTGGDRFLGQLECYVRLAEQLLREGKPERARAQVRHVFGRLPVSMRTGQFAAQIFILLKRCYRQLGNAEMAERYAAEARRRMTVPMPVVSTVKYKQTGGLLFSVIVPTYNRLPILRKCLDALESQTLPASDFEVIVIDDGSSDGTEHLLAQYQPAFRFQYLRQKNSGTGAARRNGVAHASGEYLLLMNDDTICDRDLLTEHLGVQRAFAVQQWAVLGNFEYPRAARQRALTQYFCVEPFMFPQVSMEAECPYGYSHFITCNLSVRRDSVLDAGSFDPIYKLSEDTELGIRLYERGYRVLYHPAAHALHDHLPYPALNLVRRARVYGKDYFHMFRRHPRVMSDWAMPVKLTGMDEENAIRVLDYVQAHRSEVEQALAALERWDTIDFEPFLADQAETASMVLNLVRQAVPAIHWFYLFETMLHTMIRELGLGHLATERTVIHAALGAGG